MQKCSIPPSPPLPLVFTRKFKFHLKLRGKIFRVNMKNNRISSARSFVSVLPPRALGVALFPYVDIFRPGPQLFGCLGVIAYIMAFLSEIQSCPMHGGVPFLMLGQYYRELNIDTMLLRQLPSLLISSLAPARPLQRSFPLKYSIRRDQLFRLVC